MLHWVLPLGAATGCYHWVLPLGATTGCYHWVLPLGAKPPWTFGYNTNLDAGSPSPAALPHHLRIVSEIGPLVGSSGLLPLLRSGVLMRHAASAPTMFYTLTGLFVVFIRLDQAGRRGKNGAL